MADQILEPERAGSGLRIPIFPAWIARGLRRYLAGVAHQVIRLIGNARSGWAKPQRVAMVLRRFALVSLIGFVGLWAGDATAQTDTTTASRTAAPATEPLSPAATAEGASGLPVPRFVSLKSNRVHVRSGPGTTYPISWVFQRAGLPVEIVKEFDAWRQIRDSEGAVGWIFKGLLSGRRTALILPWETGAAAKGTERPTASVFSARAETSSPVAIVEAGALVNILQCDGAWCRVSINEERGWMQQRLLWGVYEREAVE